MNGKGEIMKLKEMVKTVSRILIFAMFHLCWLTSFGWAEMVKTNELLGKELQLQITREMLIDALNREEVQKKLELNGITREEAVARINSLTDEEISTYWVEMVKTPEIITQETRPQITREMLIDALNRVEVQKQLEQYGISKVEAAGRINSLTDAEVAAIATEVGPLPSGGHTEAEEEFIEIMKWVLIILFIGVILVLYLLGVFFKGIYCIFSDCEAKGGTSYVFRPWWLNADDAFIWTDKVAPDETNDPPTETNDQPIEHNDSGDREGRY